LGSLPPISGTTASWGERPTAQFSGSPGIGGIGIVTVFVPIVKLMVVLVPVLVVVVVSSLVVSVPVVVVVVSVVVVVVSVVVVVGDGDVVVVVVVTGVRGVVVVTGVNFPLSSEFDPPKTSRMISTRMIAARAPNRTSAHGLRYHGTGGCSGGPGGSPGGCWPYPLYAVGGCSE
jgi:hypothetical protein